MTAPFHLIENPTPEDIDKLVGEVVTVEIARGILDGVQLTSNGSGISVSGKLEKSEESEKYGFLIDGPCIAQFWANEVKTIEWDEQLKRPVLSLDF
jgi:hypothetical protein